MSLNGLEDVKVTEAYEAAAAEPGGWFLLKYASRDEVELLGRGNGGIVEIRNAIACYEEPSPLFGFLRYRRRNVIIKYMPEECSRLLQARVTVHFNAIMERFSPHDTIFLISTSKELRDTTLSAACSLHTASGSISSSTSSLRRRRLMEIAEDAEDDDRAKRQSTVPEERPPTEKALSILNGTGTPHETPSGMPTFSSAQLSPDGEVFELTPREATGSVLRPRSPANMDEPRRSLQSGGPDLYRYSSYGKPKVKLGPRPSLDVGGRAYTSVSQYRPVSQLPPGLKPLFKFSKKEHNGSDSQRTYKTSSMAISPPPLQAPENSLSPDNYLVRPHTSGGRSTRSSNIVTRPLVSPTTTPKTHTMKAEKARLLKALELRKKQMSATPTSNAPTPSASELFENTAVVGGRPLSSSSDENHGKLADAVSLNDSGIAFDASSALKTDESDATRSGSYPVSPIGPSEPAASTRASSISESTDETLQESQATKKESVIETTADEGVPEPCPEPNHELGLASEDGSGAVLPSNGITFQNVVHEEYEKTVDATPKVVAGDVFTDTNVEKLDQLLPIAYKPPTSPSSDKLAVVALMATQQLEQGKALEHVANGVSPDRIKEDINDSSPQGLDVTTHNPKDIVSPQSPRATASSTEIKECNVPRSKFSVQNLYAPDTPQSTNETAYVSPTKSTTQNVLSCPDPNRSSTEDDYVHAETTGRKKKQLELVEPIRTDMELTDRSDANTDANFSSDDDLMDELQSAVFQQAKPISVSKSPISPVFPSPKKRGVEDARVSRAVSTPAGLERSNSQLLPVPTRQQEQPRVISAAASYLNSINQHSAKPLAKKVNLGSGISQRIKALEKFSSSAAGSTVTSGPPPGSSPAFFAVRKGSVREVSRSPSIADRANSLTRNNPSPSSRDSSPDTRNMRERSSPIQSRVDAFKSAPIPMAQLNRPQVESISVTARIVRDPAHPYPAKSDTGKDPMDYTPLDLKQSPLVIDHQKPATAPTQETSSGTIQERRLSNSSVKERRSSLTIVRDLINDRRTSFAERRRSTTVEPSITSPSIKSPSRPPSTHTSQRRPVSISSRISTSSNRDLPSTMSPPPTASSFSSAGEERGDKKSNRASRMLRRMSSTLSTGRKAIAHVISPTVREESEPSSMHGLHSPKSPLPSQNSLPSSVDIGDVNVQFPDTLLWKRRSMLLDAQGFLIISPALTAHSIQKEKSSMGATRRFHLSEFRTPAVPDVEMQELPNSVVLDFVDGGDLQVACEDRVGQGRILSVLQEAHRTWAACGQ